MIEGIEGRIEDVLHFPARSGGAAVAIHPNLFHHILETVPATGWQVVHDENGLHVFLTGSVAQALLATLQVQVRTMLEAQGVRLPVIQVSLSERLQRGVTGKAPLILSKLARPRP